VTRPAPFLCTLALVAFVTGLGRAAISDSDEAFYAEAAREMVASGDWITPYYNYETRFQKPILYYWLAAAAFSLGGVSEAAARLPSALSGVGLVLIAWTVGRRWYGGRVGWYAGLITATSFGYFPMARLSLPDLPLAFFIVLTTWAGFEAIEAADAGKSARSWLLLVAAGSALGMLMKGPVGLALPVMVLAPSLVLGRRPGTRLVPFTVTDLALAGATFLALAVPWYAAMAGVHGVAYLYRFFVGENLERFATDRYNEPRSVLFYVPIVVGGLLPWSSFLGLWPREAAGTLRRGWPREARAWWLVFWALTLDERIARAGRTPDRALSWCATASAAVLVAAGVLLYRVGVLLEPVGTWWAVAGPLIIAAAGLALLVSAWMVAPRRLPPTMAATATVALLAFYFSVYSGPGEEPVQQVARTVASMRREVSESATYRVLVRNLVFYAGFKQTNLENRDELVSYLNRPDRVLCVLRRDDLEALRPDLGVAPRIVAQAEYFNPAALRLGSLLRPDQRRKVELVVVIVNR
jgi:hypothetical protein